jgi:hypothetical protein
MTAPRPRRALPVVSDEREHATAPTTRPNGLVDWFTVHIEDIWSCNLDATTTVSFSGLPSDAKYKVTVTYDCDNGMFTLSSSKTVSGGSSATLAADTSCTVLGDDSGNLLIKIEKVSGSHSRLSYSLSITP